MSITTKSVFEEGSDVCPSCKSADWKSAKLVVMEGTTKTTGTLDGKITDPGMLSGGVRNVLLSDRWFSWDNPIEAEIGLTSSTSLVEEVKRLMVAHGSKLQMPNRPVKPEMTEEASILERVNAGDPPVEAVKVMLYALIAFVFFLTITGIVPKQNIGFAITVFFILIGAALWATKLAKEKRLRRENEKVKVKQAIPIYEEQLAEYEMKKNDVLKAREFLWSRARICMRCGTAYLGSD